MQIQLTKDITKPSGKVIPKDRVITVTNDYGKELILKHYAKPVGGESLPDDFVLPKKGIKKKAPIKTEETNISKINTEDNG